MLRCWGLGLQHVNLGGHNSVHNTSHPGLQQPTTKFLICILTTTSLVQLEESWLWVWSPPSLSWVSVGWWFGCTSWVLCPCVCWREIPTCFTVFPSSHCIHGVPSALWSPCNRSYTEAHFPHFIFISLSTIDFIMIGVFSCIYSDRTCSIMTFISIID